ncbi:hypothetical protein O6H91_09G115700 [Diphasiastrum complanatum]|uniref:Uncharacterized protein n=1 Tax=Diphasiastrum complanatum TaxID=34168 RepID=A0ACC2CTN9_DIPCM|nr:hypothetical protein O6H91_09G115700 [Diphasiastrum complanatum]
MLTFLMGATLVSQNPMVVPKPFSLAFYNTLDSLSIIVHFVFAINILMQINMPLTWPIPHHQGIDISMDFILEFLMTQCGCDSCMVVLIVLKIGAPYFCMEHHYNRAICSHLFLLEIVCLHVLPKYILIDWVNKFTSSFWIEFVRISDVKLLMDASYHSSIDGQSKVINLVLEDYL